MSSRKVTRQLPRSQRLVARVLRQRWTEISKNCPDREGSRCTLTGKSCCMENCVKLSRRGEEDGEKEEDLT